MHDLAAIQYTSGTTGRAKGAMLKEIGALARKDIEALLGSRVFLDLWVKVKKDWRNREGVLHNFGFGVES